MFKIIAIKEISRKIELIAKTKKRIFCFILNFLFFIFCSKLNSEFRSEKILKKEKKQQQKTFKNGD